MLDPCQHYLISAGHLYQAIQMLERTPVSPERQQRIREIEQQIAAIMKAYSVCETAEHKIHPA